MYPLDLMHWADAAKGLGLYADTHSIPTDGRRCAPPKKGDKNKKIGYPTRMLEDGELRIDSRGRKYRRMPNGSLRRVKDGN